MKKACVIIVKKDFDYYESETNIEKRVVKLYKQLVRYLFAFLVFLIIPQSKEMVTDLQTIQDTDKLLTFPVIGTWPSGNARPLWGSWVRVSSPAIDFFLRLN
jgi:hypothetical protein